MPPQRWWRSRCLACVQRREDSGLLHTTCIPLNILIGTGMLLMANDEHVAIPARVNRYAFRGERGAVLAFVHTRKA